MPYIVEATFMLLASIALLLSIGAIVWAEWAAHAPHAALETAQAWADMLDAPRAPRMPVRVSVAFDALCADFDAGRLPAQYKPLYLVRGAS